MGKNTIKGKQGQIKHVIWVFSYCLTPPKIRGKYPRRKRIMKTGTSCTTIREKALLTPSTPWTARGEVRSNWRDGGSRQMVKAHLT